MAEQAAPTQRALRLRLLGSLSIARGATTLKLPQSRKVRALLAYLALSSRPVTRAQACELLWDVPNDPRGELRWCLSKIRALVDSKTRKRLLSADGALRLDLGDCDVDAFALNAAAAHGLDELPLERLQELLGVCGGELLEGLEIARAPVFNGWLTAQRQHLRACHIALLEQLASRGGEKETLGFLEQWRALAPLDRRVHELILTTLARRERVREGTEHLAAAIKLFEDEGLDPGPLRAAWRAARAPTFAVQEIHPASLILPGDLAPAPREEMAPALRRGSIAVMPFIDRSKTPGEHGSAADALAHDITTRLAKLRSLFVIAQGSAFALRARNVGAEEAGRMLNVDYVVSGAVRAAGSRWQVSVELAETRTARIVWAESFHEKLGDAFDVLDEIGNRIVSCVVSEIELLERNRAVLKPPNSLSAWEAHHRGLWHMYRFTKADNARAHHFFSAAVKLDPTYARAHAGVSFTHFQNAFQGWAPRAREIERAYASAAQSLMLDDRDPGAHWAMGRALWLRGSHEDSVSELNRAVELSPNFAMGHYALSFVHSQSGDAQAAIHSADQSRQLSPYDPMLFAILASRALAHVRLGQFAEAVQWASKAAVRPNAHVHIKALAAISHSLAGQVDQGRDQLAKIRHKTKNYGLDDFLGAFRFSEDGAAVMARGAKRLGL